MAHTLTGRLLASADAAPIDAAMASSPGSPATCGGADGEAEGLRDDQQPADLGRDAPGDDQPWALAAVGERERHGPGEWPPRRDPDDRRRPGDERGEVSDIAACRSARESGVRWRVGGGSDAARRVAR